VYGVARVSVAGVGVGEFDFRILSFGPHAASVIEAATNKTNMTDL